MNHSPKTPLPRKWIFLALTVLMAVAAVDVGTGIQRFRRQSQRSCILCDARQIGNAAQQFMLTTNTTTVTFDYNPNTGELAGDIIPWVKKIGKNLLIPDTTINAGDARAFAIGFRDVEGGALHWFDEDGRLVSAPPKSPFDDHPGFVLSAIGYVVEGVKEISRGLF